MKNFIKAKGKFSDSLLKQNYSGITENIEKMLKLITNKNDYEKIEKTNDSITESLLKLDKLIADNIDNNNFSNKEDVIAILKTIAYSFNYIPKFITESKESIEKVKDNIIEEKEVIEENETIEKKEENDINKFNKNKKRRKR